MLWKKGLIVVDCNSTLKRVNLLSTDNIFFEKKNNNNTEILLHAYFTQIDTTLYTFD